MGKSANTLVALGLFWPAIAFSQAPSSVTLVENTAKSPTRPLLKIPVDSISIDYRNRVANVVMQPTVLARAAPEVFEPGIYDWLLEHPDRASLAWRRLGIMCAEITDRGQGVFGWTDNQGTDVAWRTVVKTDAMHVWLADGHTKLGPMLPTIPIRAVVVLNCPKTIAANGRVVVSHSTDIYLQTDSKTTAMVFKVLGSASPQLADQGASQLLIFFSGLSRYFTKHPDDIESLLAAKKR